MHALLSKRYGRFRLVDRPDPLGASARVAAYFAGDFTAFDGLPVTTGGTEFQQQCWRALRAIPVGTVTTYGALAAQLGRPKASRAVGYANSLNPVAIILACHRVIGQNRDLTGYAGGLDRKRWLLVHEGAGTFGTALR
jgi:methylated-DNA-[protein]-cysteine S-methyltransferase